MPRLTVSFEDRFWAKVNKNGPVPEHRFSLGPCWIWTASLGTAGYGQIRNNGRTLRAHRVAYELSVGPIPDGLEIDHLCRTPLCVNPDHLEAVTHKVNMERSEVGAWQRRKTHCPYGHPYSGDNVYITTDNGRRYCKTCKHIRYITGMPVAQYYGTGKGAEED